MDISVLIPVLNEGQNLKILLSLIKLKLNLLTSAYEIIVIDGGSRDNTQKICDEFGVKVIMQSKPGFGTALQEGFEFAKGNFIITMDADLSHEPEFIERMWTNRLHADVIIASRYIEGGFSRMSLFRYILSKILNRVFSFLLSLGIKDLSSNFRLYRKAALDSIQINGRGFDILEEILVKIYCKGWKIIEVPFDYKPRRYGKSHLRLMRVWKDYLKTLFKMWQLRNSIHCADYDFRAFYSKILLQRFWQRQRYNIILKFINKKRIFLDVGCGSSKVAIDNPDAIALDISLDKLRYLSSKNKNLINANAAKLPFKDSSFECVVCSQMIEHTADKTIIRELHRVLNKNGLLVIGTPDYDKLSWRFIEYIYSIFHKGGYADEHITHYTYKELKDILENTGFKILEHAYICNAELIVKVQKI